MTRQDPVAPAEELARLLVQVNALPPAVRRAFTLRKVYELGYPDIAARLHMTVPEVEQLLAEAVVRLAEALEPRGDA
ncbi:MAG TPA: sigma factor-like helix-turn-helix DNA-binding protein [Steroidobacteraceae bacterium]|jgi:DNA-directed RNA polymerase specialized sigma24 family protein